MEQELEYHRNSDSWNGSGLRFVSSTPLFETTALMMMKVTMIDDGLLIQEFFSNCACTFEFRQQFTYVNERLSTYDVRTYCAQKRCRSAGRTRTTVHQTNNLDQ